MSSVTYPENWKGVTIENISSFVGRGIGPNYSDIETDVIAINQKCIRNGKVNIDLGRYHDNASLVRHSAILNTNDICINSTGDGTIGRVGLWDKPNSKSSFFVDSHVTIVRPICEESDSKYLSELLSSEWIQNDIARYCFTGSTNQVELSRTELLQLTLYFPELKQQQKIAEILSTVDNLIDQTQNLIDKYTAVKQGMMADLFSRGINLSGTPETNKSYGQLRPSYEDAPELYQETKLGWIPKDWNIEKLENLTTKIIDGTHHTPTYTESGVPFLRVTDVQSKEINLEKIKFVSEEEHNQLIKRCNPEHGDILYSKNGTIGIPKIVDWSWDFSVFVSLCLIKPDHSQIFNKYLELVLTTEVIWTQIRVRAKQGTVTNLHLEEIREFEIPLPNSNEQKEIVIRASALQNKIDNEQDSLNKYKLIKKGLMQDLLTGKVTV
ncbi:restriction endonuclease subunit S [Shewanella sp. ENK2]|uniref:restriction endonuclease subunit S n=1 Tax=Shewanella sp. ENK2 TaxID=2775245 RepID=UPI003748DA28